MSKPFYLSKTLWLQILGLVAVLVPQTSSFIQENFLVSGSAFAALNFILRLITKSKLEIA